MSRRATFCGRAARAAYRHLLRLAPPDVRHAYEREMISTFDALSEAAAASGCWKVLRLLARETSDLWRARRPAPHFAVDFLETNTMPMISLRLGQVARSLARRPLFAITTTLMLAVGTGTTTALFSVVETVLIKPLPYPDADRLVTVFEANPSASDRTSLVAPIRLEDWHRMNRTFAAISGSYAESVTDTSQTDPERLDGRRVAPRFFSVFAADPIAGRTFTAQEEQFGGPGAAILSEALWTRRYGRDPAAIGRALVIGGQRFAIVGVMPARFSATPMDLWLPAQTPPFLLEMRNDRFFSGIGRLKPGVSLAQAVDDLDRVQRELGETFPKTDKGWSAAVADLKEARVGPRRRGLWLIFGAVGLVWLIAIANVAGLVLIEAHRRARELAVRAALGASRGQVISVVSQEVLGIAVVGGAIGLALASWLLHVIQTTFATLPRLTELALDWRALAFAALTSLAAALACGVVPALTSTRRDVTRTLAQGSRSVSGGHGVQRLLVFAQVAFGVVLCASAALLARSYYNLSQTELGFTADHVVTFHIGARWDEDRPRVGQLQVDLTSALERLPGVTAVGFTSFLPSTGATLRVQIAVDGLAGTDANGMMSVGYRSITVGYLHALGVPLIGGAWCPALRTGAAAPRIAMVNKTFVDRFASGQDLIGRQLRFGEAQAAPLTIVGVVGDIVEDGPKTAAAPYLYGCDPAGSWPDPNYVAKAVDPTAFVASLRAIVRQVDPSRAVFGVRPLQDVMDAAVEDPRVDAGVISIFAVTALLLAAIGLYGLFARLVDESRREIGVRLALGAAPRQMVSLVFADAGRLLAGGLLMGLVLTAGASRFLRAVLFGVGTFDVVTLGTAIVTLALVSAAAVLVPAIRASRIPPTEALRAE